MFHKEHPMVEERWELREEEELCYVTLLKARQKHIFISFTERRSMYVRVNPLNSRFVDELTDKSTIKKTVK